MRKYDYGSWTVDHAGLAALILAAGGAVGTLAGAGVAWLLASLGWLSGDNVLVGFGLGLGFAVAGMMTTHYGLLARLDRR